MTKATSSDPFGLVAACMPDFGAVESGRGPGELRVSLPVPLSDGRVPVYSLSITVVGTSAWAREITPSLLPAFCPERHINRDGSLCLYWHALDDIVIDGPQAAREWWETLVRFLQLQTRAARLRRWPDGHGRAHGTAALHQLRAEMAAARLGEPFPSDLAGGRLTVLVRGGGANGPAIRVLRDGRRFYSVWKRSRRVVNLRRPCLCPAGARGRPSVLRSCGDHAEAAATLALELHRTVEEERRFWNAVRGAPCCGTMDGCPLAAPSCPPLQRNPMTDVCSGTLEMLDHDELERQV